MPVGDIDCPSSASIPRDCSHECRVCRVTVMGLSTYAKHISSQLHKDNVDALDKEEEKDEEEEYFDKELIQLINQRREQSQQEDNYNLSKEQQSDRYARGDDRHSYQCIDQQDWHQDHRERTWQWQKECFNNPRQNFMHSSLNHHSNRHLGGPRGRAGWHMNNQSKRQLVHVNVGSWHSNAGGATSWHQRGTGRNFHWHPEGKGNFPSPPSRNYAGNWQHNAYSNNQWNFGGKTNTFPQGRKWLQMHSDVAHDQKSGLSKKNISNSFCKERFQWKKHENNTSSCTAHTNSDRHSSKLTDDFTSDDHIENNFMDFKMVESLDSSHKTKPPLCPEKGNSLIRDRQHRWSPYPSQKFLDQLVFPGSEKTLINQSEETQPDQCEGLPKPKMNEDNHVPEMCTERSEGRKPDHNELRNSRMPSLKFPLPTIPDIKSLTLKRDKKNPLKDLKFLYPAFGERQNRLSALNLETVGSNSYLSKLRSAPKNTKTIQEAQEYNNEALEETLSKVLDKAREMLRKSQAIQSSDVLSLSSASNDLKTGTNKTTTHSSPICVSSDEVLEEVSDDDLLNNAPKMDNTVESASSSDGNWSNNADNGTKSSEQTATRSNTNPVLSVSTKKCLISKSISLDERNDFSHQSQINDCEHFENNSDPDCQKSASHSANPVLPDLSKLGLPVSLQRDLTRHIGSRSKAGTHLLEPNLNSARRIRNVSGHRKSDGDKDSGLKPTLRQILNASRRNINWEQVIQHVTKKKQELGKGLPRFGIEMVAQVQSEQEGLDFDEDSDLGIENYHWDGITASPLASTRKRSLSESSVAVEKASVYDLLNNHNSDTGGDSSIATRQITPSACGPKVASTMTLPMKHEEADCSPILPPSPPSSSVSNAKSHETSQSRNEKEETCVPADGACTFQNACDNVVTTSNTNMDVGTDSCGSGTEQNDAQGVGKKRRATGDGSCTESLHLERNSKRRKIRARKERSQVDHLLSISLKEEELNYSLQGIDGSLNQARAALQAAYLEVQRLMVLKQQITMEMSTLRTQRIRILQGLQGTFESVSDGREGRPNVTAPQTPAVDTRNVFPFSAETPPRLSTQTPSNPVLPAPIPLCMPTAVPPAPAALPAIPDSSVVIKQEPMSPEATGKIVSTPPPPSALSPIETKGEGIQSTSVYPVITASMTLSELSSKFPALNTELSIDKQNVSTATSPPPPYFSPKKESPPSPVPSSLHGQSPFISTFISTFPDEPACLTAPSESLQSTLVTIETKVAKKKKKLRKKKTLRATHVPENSDTEQEVSKPARKVRSKWLSKETTVSTSTSLEQEADTLSQEAEMNKNDSDSSIEVMEVPNPRFQVVEIHSEDEKPDSPSKTTELGCTNQGCSETNDEVTSTSELGASFNEGSLASLDHRASTPGTKNCSEVSSDPGEDEDPTEGTFEGHQASVNAMQVYCGVLYTCSADKSVRAYNLVTRKCKAVFQGHTSKVNCLLVTHARGKNIVLFTGSSDHTIRCFNVKTQECFDTLDLGERVLCLHTRWRILYAGLANGTVVTLNTKCNKQIDTFECHGPRAVSCLATAQEGARRLLLVGSYDCTISVRDARNGLLLRTLEGHTKTVLCMKVVNDLVFSGSSDQSVHAHNIHTGELIRIYKGHNHAVTVVTILGQVMVTACLDKFVRVYELQSHDRLQVYGGHSDMIMCMAIYKSMIYTGCYDGRVQAVRLNLMQNYRCWWHGCSLIFGVAEHLKQHLLNDHTNPNFQTLKCRWKNCDGFFTARRGSKQDAIGHLERHAEDSQGNA